MTTSYVGNLKIYEMKVKTYDLKVRGYENEAQICKSMTGTFGAI